VISEWKPIGFLVAPFSRYPVPALPGEFRTSRDEPPLKTLALWNSHTMEPNALARSWLVDRLAPEDTRAARAVFRHVMFGHAIADDLLDRTGAPLAHPEDPRLAYERAELLRVTGLGRLQHHLERTVTRGDILNLIAEAERIANTPAAAAAPPPELALAAATTFHNRAIVLSPAGRPTPGRQTFVAEADGEFILEPGQSMIPSTLWVLRDVNAADAAILAGARVLFLDRRHEALVAEGHVDASGSVLAADHIHPEALAGETLHAGDLTLIILIE
jgi:hypothetical protein